MRDKFRYVTVIFGVQRHVSNAILLMSLNCWPRILAAATLPWERKCWLDYYVTTLKLTRHNKTTMLFTYMWFKWSQFTAHEAYYS